MHVAIVCREAGGTGSVALVALRHAALLRREFRVTLMSDSLPDQLPEGVLGLHIRARSFNALRRLAHVPNEIAFALAARRALFSMDDVDFVLCEGDVPAALAARVLQRKKGTPFGIVTHGDIAGRPRGTFDSRLSALYRWAEKRSACAADLVIALGPTMAELARRRGAKETAIAIVPNGVDVIPSREDRGGSAGEEHRGASAPLRITYVGRLALEKGVLVLSDAAQILHDRAIAFELTFVGAGPLEGELRSRGANLAGRQPHDQIHAWFRAADVAVVPSIDEPFGLVIIEALASGTPVIASDVNDIRSIVRERENGLLVPPNDAVALANAIELLATDRALLSKLARNARSSVWPRFSWEESGRLLRDAVRSRLRHNR